MTKSAFVQREREGLGSIELVDLALNLFVPLNYILENPSGNNIDEVVSLK